MDFNPFLTAVLAGEFDEDAELLRVKTRCSELDVDYLEDPDPWIELRLNRIRLGACEAYLASRDRV